MVFFFFKQKTAYEMRISDWSSDVCSSDLGDDALFVGHAEIVERRRGMAHRRPVGLAAHDDADDGCCGHVFCTFRSGMAGAGRLGIRSGALYGESAPAPAGG